MQARGVKPVTFSLYPHEIAWLDEVVRTELDARNSRAEVVRTMIHFFASRSTNPFCTNPLAVEDLDVRVHGVEAVAD